MLSKCHIDHLYKIISGTILMLKLDVLPSQRKGFNLNMWTCLIPEDDITVVSTNNARDILYIGCPRLPSDVN